MFPELEVAIFISQFRMKESTNAGVFVQYAAAFTSSLSTLCGGAVIGWSSPALPQLLAADSPIPVTGPQATWIVTLSLIASAVFTLPACYLSDAIGRKNTILLSGVPYLVAFILITKATSVETLYVARVLFGVGFAVANCIPVMYIAEISEVHIRGRLLVIFSVAFFAGILFSYVTGAVLPISTQSAVSALIPTLLLTVFVWMPASPYFRIQKGDVAGARAALHALRGHADVEHELQLISEEVNRVRRKTPSWRNLVTEGGLRRALLTSIGLVLSEQMSGIIPITIYAETIFTEAGATFITPSMASISLQSCLLVASIGGMLLSDRCGRRLLLLFSACISWTTLAGLGLYFLARDVLDYDVSRLGWTPVVVMFVNIMGSVCGLGNLAIAMSAEFFPMEYKRAATIIVITFVHIGSSTAVLLFNCIWKSYGIHCVFLLFAAIGAVNFLFIWVFVPETANKTFKDIQVWFRIVTPTGYEQVSTK